jgi:large conductance mechanosensitive channel
VSPEPPGFSLAEAEGGAMFSEFRQFVNQGNAIDLAVGVMIGAAFGKIVNSLVADIIMPVLGLALGRVDFANRYLALNGATYESLAAARLDDAPVLAYGAFINVVVEFFVIAFTIFLVVRQINRFRGDKPAA